MSCAITLCNPDMKKEKLTYDTMYPLIQQSELTSLIERYKINRLLLCSALHISLAMLQDFEHGTVRFSEKQHIDCSRFFAHYKMAYTEK